MSTYREVQFTLTLNVYPQEGVSEREQIRQIIRDIRTFLKQYWWGHILYQPTLKEDPHMQFTVGVDEDTLENIRGYLRMSVWILSFTQTDVTPNL